MSCGSKSPDGHTCAREVGHEGRHRGGSPYIEDVPWVEWDTRPTLAPPLTRRQREVLNFIVEFLAANGYAPSFEDLGRGLGITSTATTFKHLDNLQRKGYIRRRYNRKRDIELVEHDRTLETYLAGVIAARDELRTLLRHAVDQVTVEFIPNDRALWAGDEAPIYQCHSCRRPVYARHTGATRIECHPDGHYLYRLSVDVLKALAG